ncbi:sodium:calcium antiporter [Rhodovulum sp. 12E13]|uniref:calcium/sodium antiporter n=1 Tax=Rhodovulum sp. 12E13 TaxID=2203891 RepID=UPI000E1884B1|nr:calcium/sodium antiporter [Rhodovulum sp. 12E13]RDC72092.1 sodium:calcium antiporter [Rhodovulum sp. 12E13]
MLTDILLASLGLVILLLAGDALVRGAVNLALRIGVPALLVSLTIVAFGTSAPELLISVAAILDGAPGIALGNVVGSNTANILLVLGIPALMTGLATEGHDTRKTYSMMIAASVLFIALAFAGPFTWWHGLILLAGLSVVLGDAFRSARNHRRDNREAAEAAVEAEEIDLEGADDEMPGWKVALFLVLGLVGLPLGADILVDSSVRIAETLGVPDTVIGLTLIAIGTSLPELATTVMAAIRRQADVALGNVIGSNMFNLLAIIGVSSFVGEIPVDPVLLRFDLWVMLGASLLLAPFVFLHWRMGRAWGVALSALYVGYLYLVVA